MGADAYAILGLEPGADAAAVDAAYRRLIKEHHPDREGGDSTRAAELNHAYRELRSALRMKDDIALHPLFPAKRSGWSRPTWVALLLGILGSVFLLFMLFSPETARQLAGDGRGVALVPRSDPMESPLVLAAVDEAVIDAVRVSRSGDEMALYARSRDCHRDLRSSPSLAGFDRCAAFDLAVIRLEDRDPLRDKGPFSQIAVTGRLFSAAAALSGDYLATDSRLQRIRVRVELMLAPNATNAGAN